MDKMLDMYECKLLSVISLGSLAAEKLISEFFALLINEILLF